ncbi:MAG: glycosyltransferase [Acidimicrobiales bacterium]
MRLGIVTWRDTANPLAGGAETLVDRIATGIREQGHDVTVICGGPTEHHPYRVLRSGGTYTQYLRVPFIVRKLERRNGRFDLLIDVENGIPFFSPLWRRGPKACLVHHVHTDQWSTRFPAPVAALGNFIEKILMPLAYRNTTFVAVSSSTASALIDIGVDRRNINVIENGVAAHVPAYAESQHPLFVAIGRLVPHKQVDIILDAWRNVQRVLPEGRLVVVGAGPEYKHLAKHLPPHCELPGHISEEEKTKLLDQCWMLVHAAHHEGWGMVILEAAASGKPSIALDAPGVRDAIIDGVTGILCRDRQALENAWLSLARDTSMRHKMGAAAHKRALDLSWQSTVKKYLALMEVRTSPGSRYRRDVKRSIRLFRAFAMQIDRPDFYYTLLAADTVSLVSMYTTLDGKRVLDVGGGAGYFAASFRDAGALSYLIEIDPHEMGEGVAHGEYGILGDGRALPFADGTFSITHSSNVLEHVSDAKNFLEEMIRVTSEGGIIFVAFTNWLSPFGGHETSPWHFFGGNYAANRYRTRHGRYPKNLYGKTLFRLDLSTFLAWVASREDVTLIDRFPRYYPGWARPLAAVPGLREIACWNLVAVLRKKQNTPDSSRMLGKCTPLEGTVPEAVS